MTIPLTTIVPLQTTPTGGSSPLTLLAVLGVALFAVDRWVTDLGRFVPSFGDSSDSGSGSLVPALPFVSTNGLLLGGVFIALALVAVGILDVPPGSSIPLIVALTLLGVFLTLRELDAYDPVFFGVTALATVTIALSAVGEPVIGSVVNSDIAPILAVGALIVGWRLTRPRPIVVGEGGDDET